MGKKLGEVLVEKNLVTRSQIDEIRKEQARSNKLIGELLVERQLLSEILLYQALAQQHQMLFVDLDSIKVSPRLLQQIPFELLEEYGMVPLDIKDEILIVAVSSPRTTCPRSELMVLTGAHDVQCVLSLPVQVEAFLRDNFK